MIRSPIEDLLGIEGAQTDPGLTSTTLARLIHASRECEVKIFDSDIRRGTYVVVLEGTLENGNGGPAGN
ncbi:MAG: hypothetical protein L0191_05650 [Acidobacteria bacterium]|nr:hypothetical protein [Acidobacteriota bacterium]